MRRILALTLVLTLGFSSVALAVGGDKAQYIGGTISAIKDKSEGTLATKSDTEIVFTAKGGTVTIPYASVESLEYGQKAGRRIGVAIMVSPLALFSKKRNHFLIISYKDAAGKDQSGVFELGKDIVRTTLTILKTRTGKEIEYQDEEARKSGLGN